jgi:hypothetical protein
MLYLDVKQIIVKIASVISKKLPNPYLTTAITDKSFIEASKHFKKNPENVLTV